MRCDQSVPAYKQSITVRELEKKKKTNLRRQDISLAFAMILRDASSLKERPFADIMMEASRC